MIQKADILIVDDQLLNLKALAAMLKEHDYQVRPALNGELALNAAFKSPPDLILMDIAMPGMDGYQVCQALKENEKTNSVPIIFLSASNETEDKIKAFAAGGVDYITKPFHAEEVIARVGTHLKMRYLQYELQDKNASLKQEMEEKSKIKERLEHTIEISEQGIWEHNLGYKPDFFSDYMFTMLNYEVLPHYKAKNFFKSVAHPEDQEKLFKAYKRLFFDQNTYQEEIRLKNKQGQWRDILCKGRCLLWDEEGFPLQILSAFSDITEIKETTHKAQQSEQMFHSIFQHAPLGIALEDKGRTAILTNTALQTMLEYSEQELQKTSFIHLTHPDDRDKDLSLYKKILNNEIDNYTVEKRYLTKSNKVIWGALTISAIKDKANNPVYIIGMLEDITSKQKDQERLRQTMTVFNNTIEGITITDKNGNIIAVNPAFTRITGYCEIEVLGKNPRILKSDKHDRAFYQALWQVLLENKQWRGEIWNRRKDGTIYPEWLTITMVNNEEGDIINYVGIFADLSETKRFQQQLDYLTYFDPLTHLPNQRAFKIRLTQALQKDQEHNIAVLCIDIDNFKDINAHFGYKAGDILLQQLVKRIKKLLRIGMGDVLAHQSADEFLLFLDSIKNPQDAGSFAQHILDNIKEIPFLANEKEVYLTASIGICIYPSDCKEVTTLIKHANSAMHQAKMQGGNNYQYYSKKIAADAFQQVFMQSYLRNALKHEQLELYYQPKILFKDNSIIGAEALIRWQHPALGVVNPDQFIPLAEANGFIVEMGGWIIRQVCLQIQKWNQEGLVLNHISINISAKQLEDENFLDSIKTTIKELLEDPSKIELELTETLLMQKEEQIVQLMENLTHIGLTLSIDDFGTGYSSLSYLKNFPIHKLKIDKSFIRDIPGDASSENIVRAIIALGHSLHLTIVAEGVETALQAMFLKAEDCDEAQGYFYSQPLPANEFAEFIRNYKK